MYESTNKTTIKMSTNNSTMSWAGMAKAAPKAKENLLKKEEQDTVLLEQNQVPMERNTVLNEQDTVLNEHNQVLKEPATVFEEVNILKDNYPALKEPITVKKLTKSSKKSVKNNENSNIVLDITSGIVEKQIIVFEEQNIKFEEIYNKKENNFYIPDYHHLSNKQEVNINKQEVNIIKENSSLITRLCETKLLEYKIKDTAFKYKNTHYSAEISNIFAEKEYEEAFNFMYKKVSKKYMNSSELINMFVICNDSNIWSFHDEKLEELKPEQILLNSESTIIKTNLVETQLLKEQEINKSVMFLKKNDDANEEQVINYNNFPNFNQNMSEPDKSINTKSDEWIETSNTRNKKPFILDRKKVEKNNKLKEIAKDFANSLIKDGSEIRKNMNNDTELLYKISIDCTNKVLGYIGDIPVIPSKFLDPTYIINGDSKIKSAAHQQFKIEFLNILENKLGDHNMHLRWDKDNDLNNPNKDMLFHICFFKKIFKNNYLSNHFKQNY